MSELIERLKAAHENMRLNMDRLETSFTTSDDYDALGEAIADLSSSQPMPVAAEPAKEQRNQQLQVGIESGVLRISIGVDLLCHAVQVPWKEQGINWKIVNKDVFAKALATELEREDEEGSTPVHFLFDKAADEVLEQGADGAKEFQDDDDEDEDDDE